MYIGHIFIVSLELDGLAPNGDGAKMYAYQLLDDIRHLCVSEQTIYVYIYKYIYVYSRKYIYRHL